MTVDGVHCGPDGMRADVFGNLWCSSNAPLGYAGVLVYNARGKLIGRIRLPEVCANLCFGGPKELWRTALAIRHHEVRRAPLPTIVLTLGRRSCRDRQSQTTPPRGFGCERDCIPTSPSGPRQLLVYAASPIVVSPPARPQLSAPEMTGPNGT